MARKKSKDSEEADLFDTIPEVSEGKKKALDAALTDITKRYGDGAIMRLGDARHLAVDIIPSAH